MKNNLFIIVILLLFLASCESKNRESSDVNLEASQKEEVKTGYDVIYSNKNCLKPEVETYPIIQLENDSQDKSGSVSGKAFFSNNYLRSIV